MAKQELVVTASNATAADIAAFQGGDEQRLSDLAAYMQGTPHQEGGRHDMTARGLTTDRGEWQQPPDTTATTSLIPEQPDFVGAPPQPSAPPDGDADHWRKLYGDSENEKGELRRALQQQLERNEAYAAQLAAQQPPYGYPPQPPQYTPPPSYGYPPPPPAYPTPPPNYGYTPVAPHIAQPMRFVNKPDGEMLVAEDIEAVIQQHLAPAFSQTYNESKAASERVARLEAMLVAREKQSLGITPQLESQALIERPYIRSIPDPMQQVRAIAEYVDYKRAQAMASGPPSPLQRMPAPSQAQMPATSASAARRVTYVEGGRAATPNEEGGPGAFERELAVAMQQPFNTRAKAMEAVYTKYGHRQVNDWRDPSIVTR